MNRPIDADKNSFLRGPRASEALRIIQQLRDSGFVAYLAGGCVRDALLGKPPKDYDVATDATPEVVREVFGKRRTIAFGASFGVIGVLPPRDSQSGDTIEPTEVATFRSDGYYSDGRRPDSVHYGDALHDAQRRDFTINGLFYDPHEDTVIDHVDGQADLQRGVLRTIGDPLQRFGEDKLRMLRAVRFATTLGFTIESATREAIVGHARDIAVVSGERIGAEMRRIFVSPHAVSGLGHLVASGLQAMVLPELSPLASRGMDQQGRDSLADEIPADGESVNSCLRTRLKRLEQMDSHAYPRSFPVLLACVCLVTDDPPRALSTIGQRWRLSNEEKRQAGAALKHWQKIATADQAAWSTVQPILVDRDAETIVSVAGAVVAADNGSLDGVKLSLEALGWPASKLDPPPLLTGADLQALGIRPGPDYAKILKATRECQLDGKITTREQAIVFVNQVNS